VNNIKELKILLLQGLPGVGKSFWAKAFIKDNPGWVRINKDDLRSMMHDGKWSPSNEKLVLAAQDELVRSALMNRKNVILDNTNFETRHECRARDLAAEFTTQTNIPVTIEVKFFDVELNECITRDAKRSNPVGVSVIRDMWDKYLKNNYIVHQNTSLPTAFIVDIDGTVARNVGRSPYDWDKVDQDEPIYDVLYLANCLDIYGEIIFVSGRDEVCRDKTKSWLLKHFGKDSPLYMRPHGDNRKDTIIKEKIFRDHILDKYYVRLVIDDRSSVVSLWRDKLGLTCLQCANGDF
jgi:predicted kinase